MLPVDRNAMDHALGPGRLGADNLDDAHVVRVHARDYSRKPAAEPRARWSTQGVLVLVGVEEGTGDGGAGGAGNTMPLHDGPLLSASRTTRCTSPPPRPTRACGASRPSPRSSCAATPKRAPSRARPRRGSPFLGRARVWRLDGLLRAFSAAPPPRRVAFPRMEGVEVLSGGLTPWKSLRYSRRQGQRFPLDGLVGSATVHGDAMPATT